MTDNMCHICIVQISVIFSDLWWATVIQLIVKMYCRKIKHGGYVDDYVR